MNSPSTRTISVLSLIGLLAALLAVAGCSGSASTQSSQVRFINAVPNGGSASFLANGAFAGDETFFNQSAYETVHDTIDLLIHIELAPGDFIYLVQHDSSEWIILYGGCHGPGGCDYIRNRRLPANPGCAG